MAKDVGKCNGKHYILLSSAIEVSISNNILGSFDINKLRAKLFNE
jgi:hypothetical protein